MTARAGFPRSSWSLIVAMGVIWLLFGVVFYVPLDMLFGNGPPSAYSAIAQKELSASSRLVAAMLILTGAVQIVLGAVPFRRGEKWSWFAYAAFPLVGVLEFYALLFVVLPTLALLLSAKSALAVRY